MNECQSNGLLKFVLFSQLLYKIVILIVFNCLYIYIHKNTLIYYELIIINPQQAKNNERKKVEAKITIDSGLINFNESNIILPKYFFGVYFCIFHL